MRRKLAVSARALGVHWVEHPSNAMRHHVDLRLLVRACFSPVSAAFQLELPDSQLGCHGRLSSRHGLDSGDSDQQRLAVGISPRPATKPLNAKIQHEQSQNICHQPYRTPQ
ncbi:hypothetical protein G3M48_009823 [Beauveria asiatica]|uniref:Uncharacterized protein n=1 Tax=Beauveria asiatica TaxID=1069075 RepID=A0AAW0S2R5_9HYPO